MCNLFKMVLESVVLLLQNGYVELQDRVCYILYPCVNCGGRKYTLHRVSEEYRGVCSICHGRGWSRDYSGFGNKYDNDYNLFALIVIVCVILLGVILLVKT